ncbi:uridine kinase family protein [Angustibacter sp. McL0619]|uniref:uridine kinase family protein n=1 Tax=Angustibacter sp. McL0619 TaxID=3415676 RepID=UPI003CE89DEE
MQANPIRLVVLAGPSGSGKSHLAARLGLPVLRLDDFYRDGDDADLPRAFGIVDWDDPASWDCDAAVRCATQLCATGRADVPRYDIPTSRVVGHVVLDCGGSPLVVAEGIFAAEAIGPFRDAGLLADAICLSHRPVITFVRRLARDLSERRKPPLTLVRRGWGLLRAEPAIVARQVALGAEPCTPKQAEQRIRRLLAES